jgi:hypothetical protein
VTTEGVELRVFLYFPDIVDAEAMATVLLEQGWETDIRLDDSVRLLGVKVVDDAGIDEEVRRAERSFPNLARRHNGEYDGFEAGRRRD